jgi:hypothetical protein
VAERGNRQSGCYRQNSVSVKFDSFIRPELFFQSSYALIEKLSKEYIFIRHSVILPPNFLWVSIWMLQTINRLCLIFFLLLGLLLQNVSFRLNYGTKPLSISFSRYNDERFSLGYRFVIRRGKVIGLFTTLPEKIITESQHPIQNGNSKRVYIPRSDRNNQQSNIPSSLHSLQSSLPVQGESEITGSAGKTKPPTTTQSTSERKAYVPQAAHRKIGTNRSISFQNGKRTYLESKSTNFSSSAEKKNQLPYVTPMHSPAGSNSASIGKHKSRFGTKNITTNFKPPVDPALHEEIVQMRLAKMRKEFEELHPIEIPTRPLSISLDLTEQNRSSRNGTEDVLIGYLRAENSQIMNSPSLVRRIQKVVKKKPSQGKPIPLQLFLSPMLLLE